MGERDEHRLPSSARAVCCAVCVCVDACLAKPERNPFLVVHIVRMKCTHKIQNWSVHSTATDMVEQVSQEAVILLLRCYLEVLVGIMYQYL